jgi:hypothetical protein
VRAAGERQAEQARALVDGLAGGVVERLAQDGEAGVVVDAGQERVAAGGDQAQERRGERLAVGAARVQEVGGDVALQVVDGRQRQAARRREALRRGDADEQRADEAGPAVTATRSTSSSVAPAWASASSTTGVASSKWWREATSGTTPP